MENIDEQVIRLSKTVKIIGIIDIAVFSVITLIAFITGNGFASIAFMAFVLLGVILLLAYKKQMLIIKDNEIEFNYLFKKTQHVRYEQIRCLLLIPLNNRTQRALIDRQYQRIISLDEMLADVGILFEALEKKQIEVVDLGELVEKGSKDVSKYFPALNGIERNYYKSLINENKTIESMPRKNKKAVVKNTKKLLKIIGWVLIFANLAAFLIGGKAMLIILIAVLVFTYGLYIFYYPYIYTDAFSKKGQNQCLQVPFGGAVIAMLLSLTLSQLWNYDFDSFMKSTAGITAILALVFIIKSLRVSVPQRLGRKLSVIFAAFIIAFSITFPVNFLLTVDKATHVATVITDKDISGGRTRDYYLYCMWNGSEERFNVSKKEYNETAIGDKKRICIRKSILGLEYCTIHK